MSFAIWCTSLSLFPGADSCALPNAISATIDLRIAELVDLKTAVDSFANRLSEVMAHQPGQVSAEQRGERRMITYDYAMGPTNDLALGMRRVLMDIEKTHGLLTYEPGILASYDDFARNGIVLPKRIIVELDNPIDASAQGGTGRSLHEVSVLVR